MAEKTFNNVIGAKVRELRLKENLRQSEVAKRLGVSIPAYSKIETGLTGINIQRLTQIATLFNVPVEDLLVGVKSQAADVKAQVAEITALRAAIARLEDDIVKVRKKLIGLYEELDQLNPRRR